ncbi:MAG: hypothetical protein EAZ42_10400 [Verrucomicrobia bacterium]|nr:MAG: hypothetical protein EAZ42_10400 [Verrucomicrobiota bacterium]
MKFVTLSLAVVMPFLASCYDPFEPYPYPDQRYRGPDRYGRDDRDSRYRRDDRDLSYRDRDVRPPMDPRRDPNRLLPEPPLPRQPIRPDTRTSPEQGGYPMATRTANPNQVLSPYEPFNVIDVEGFRSGQLARDPSNQKIFRIP